MCKKNDLWFQSAAGRVHHAARLLRGQLDQAVSRIRTLEAELKHEVSGSEDWAPVSCSLLHFRQLNM